MIFTLFAAFNLIYAFYSLALKQYNFRIKKKKEKDFTKLFQIWSNNPWIKKKRKYFEKKSTEFSKDLIFSSNKIKFELLTYVEKLFQHIFTFNVKELLTLFLELNHKSNQIKQFSGKFKNWIELILLKTKLLVNFVYVTVCAWFTVQ